MPAGFFVGAIGTGRTHPSNMVGLPAAGAVMLGCGSVSLGIGLLTS